DSAEEVQGFEFGFRSAGFGICSIRLGFRSENLGVRRETGEEHEVKVLYGEGFAHRTGPEPCAVDREVGGEASAGGGIGQPLSRERFVIPGADGVPRSEGDADRRKTARTVPARRGQRPGMCSSSSRGNREI